MARGTSLLGGGSSNALHTLCRRALPSIAFRKSLRAPLRSLIEFDAYCVNTCDVDTGVVTSSVGDGLTPEQSRALFALEAEGEDFSSLRELHRGSQRIASIWQSTGGELERSPRMRQIFVPLGFGDELRAALAVGGACFGYLHLFRRASSSRFRPAELKRLERITPMIASSLRRAAEEDAARSDRSDRLGPGLLLLDSSNRLIRSSEAAPAAVADLDCLRVDSGPAHLLQDLASRSRAGAAPRAKLVRAGAVARSLSAVQVGEQTAIVIDLLKADDGRALLRSAMTLTSREREVSACIARGDTNRQVAAQLGISLYTVKDYVKAILRKTGCANRAGLAARWNGPSP